MMMTMMMMMMMIVDDDDDNDYDGEEVAVILSLSFFSCYDPCIHGTCGPDYTCHCDLGWLGGNCTIDCGCHGHSSCNQGIGTCDKCQGK
jgi:hypothetical protein